MNSSKPIIVNPFKENETSQKVHKALKQIDQEDNQIPLTKTKRSTVGQLPNRYKD